MRTARRLRIEVFNVALKRSIDIPSGNYLQIAAGDEQCGTTVGYEYFQGNSLRRVDAFVMNLNSAGPQHC
jgi:hypothetical protein